MRPVERLTATPARTGAAMTTGPLKLGAPPAKTLDIPSSFPTKAPDQDEDGLEYIYLREYFGHEQFRPGQREVIQAALSGRDVAVFWATGAGKSLCYQLPALQMGKTAIIVSPLISLMTDQVTKFNATVGTAEGKHTACFLGSAQFDPQVEQQALRGEHRLVYVTPEKLTGGFLRQLKPLLLEQKLGLLAIDEAHCISEWGHDFRPSYRELRHVREELPGLPIIALTATAVPRVQADIVEQLGLKRDMLKSANSFDRPNLRIACSRKQGKASDLEKIASQIAAQGGSTIVYVPTQAETESVAAYLAEKLAPRQIAVRCYHGGMANTLRDDAHFAFLSGAAKVIVATVAFGMGIDKPDIRKIVHYGPPKTVEEYFQQIGRAGRDGLISHCHMVAADSDFGNYASDFYLKGLTPQAREQQLKSTDALRQFAGGTCGCRRRWLLQYFGEVAPFAQCGTCDLCAAVAKHGSDATRDFRQAVAPILAAVAATQSLPQGITSLWQVISGTKDWRGTKRTIQQMRDPLPRIMKTEATTRELITALVSSGHLERTRVTLQNTGREFGNAFDAFVLTPKGEKARIAKEEIRLAVPQPIRLQEEEAERRAAARVQEIKSAGFDPSKIPPKELDDDGGPLLWYIRKLKMWRDSGDEAKIKTADKHEELRKRIIAWRDSTAQALRMAPADVLAEHVIVKIAYVKATDVNGLRAAGVRIARIEELADLMAKSKEELFPASDVAASSTQGDASQPQRRAVMCLPEGPWTPPMKWPRAVYKPGKAGAKPPWEVSYDRFFKGESVPAIAMNQSGKPIQAATVVGHICEALKFAKPVDLARLARESETRLPVEEEWQRLEEAAAERNMNVDADDYKAKEVLCGVLGAKVNREPAEKSDADKEEEKSWYNLIRWWEPLKRARFPVKFEDAAKRQRT